MSLLSGLNSNGLAFSGLATGINTDSLIAGLTKINQRRIDALKAREATLQARQSAFATLQGRAFDLQSKAAALARSVGGAFDARQATSSDTAALTAVAGSAALPGTYNLTVTALAQAHQLASEGYADINTQIKQGTLTLQVGSGPATTITIDAQNNTLQGLVSAINASDAGVRASIINDGSDSPFRVVLTSTRTGAANAIQVTANLTSGSGADFDPAAITLQAASDAEVRFGSGPSALVVTSSTNQFNNLIPGVSINVLRADNSKPLTLTVAPDTAAATRAVQEFVNSYNAVIDFIAQQSNFDPKTQTGGVLLGNRDARQLTNELAAALVVAVPGLNPAANRLSSVGITFDNRGRLVLDSAKLDRVLKGETGASIADLKRLFGLTGVVSNNPGIEFVSGSDKTKPTGNTPYEVHITAPATRATVTAASPPLLIWPPNASLMLRLNNIAGEVTLPAGVYTPDELVSTLQRRINETPAFAGNTVAVSLNSNGHLQITSQRFGSSSRVEILGGTAAAGLGFTGTESATGTDVEGYFVVNSQNEAATGNGQLLRGNAGNANTDGLQVRATLTAPGSAELTVTQGLASRLNQVLNKYLDVGRGRFQAIREGFQRSIDDIGRTISRQNDMLSQRTQELLRQFAAMESAVNSLRGLQTQLSSLIQQRRN